MIKKIANYIFAPEHFSMVMTFGLLLLFTFALLPPVFFFTYARELSYWWLILFFLYYGFLCFCLWYILHRREMREARMYLGTEKFYQQFPKERRRDERIAKIQGKLDEIFF